MEVKITYRGWPGHYICAKECLFRLNTLVKCGGVAVVISTVGNKSPDEDLRSFVDPERSGWCMEPIGLDRYYETMAFIANDSEYRDADVSKEVRFDSKWSLDINDLKNGAPDLQACAMHEAVVQEVVEHIYDGTLKIVGPHGD